MLPAIIIAAYNRPNSLQRILQSIHIADYPKNKDIPLIISIDGGSVHNDTLKDIATAFKWDYGEKKIIMHENNLGLKQHILSCGDLSNEYESVIILEDDIVVSPGFYVYAQIVGDYYKEDETINQISLYSYGIVEYTNLPFHPIMTSDSVYFLQTGSSWGQLWTNKQWQRFRKWLFQNETTLDFDQIMMPKAVKLWPSNTSWKKWFNAFLIDTNTYCVVPYRSFSSNCGDDGIHHRSIGNMFQVPLAYSFMCFKLPNINDSICVYDAFFEIETTRFTKIIQPYIAYKIKNNERIVSDFNGLKDIKNDKENILTITSRAVRRYIASYNNHFLPPIFNISFSRDGTSYYLAYSKNIDYTKKNKYVFKQQMQLIITYPFFVLISTVFAKLKSRILYRLIPNIITSPPPPPPLIIFILNQSAQEYLILMVLS
jgi:hypothetical protein